MDEELVVYDSESMGVVFCFLNNGDEVWGWVSKKDLETLSGKKLDHISCVDMYYEHKKEIQKLVLQERDSYTDI